MGDRSTELAGPLRIVIGPMLRYVDETSATIFVETSARCVVEICGRTASTFEVGGHHFALVMLEGLAPGSVSSYEVRLDGALEWPPEGSDFPASVIRTLVPGQTVRLLFGSCRAAGPHEPPWSLSQTEHPLGHGVDSLRAHGLRMMKESPATWPDLLLLLGDQVYADAPSPLTKARMRFRPRSDTTPPDIVSGFEEYTRLYHESWQPDVERWVFSVVPSAMIFDDHDMIDDWNISASWVREIRALPWWQEHVLGALTSYWIYQHLGNLSPAEIRAEGLLEEIASAGNDGNAVLRAWAMESERLTPVEGGYRFSFVRDLGRTRLVVIDCRNGRVLEPGRAMIGREEWAWVGEQCRVEIDHLLLATSLPVMVLGGLHPLQIWNEALCDGRWGSWVAKVSERLRRRIDLEDWPAFHRSFDEMMDLLCEVATGTGASTEVPPPAMVAVLSGDIHFSYVATVELPAATAVASTPSRVYQIVSSPIRNSLKQRDRHIMRFAISRVGLLIGKVMAASIGASKPRVSWSLTHGPTFANEMAQLTIEGRCVQLLIERARPDDEGHAILEEVVSTAL